MENSNRKGHGSNVNPFPGLKPYEVEDSHFYYSYGYRTDDILSRLRENRFITLVGDAGSGKASLVNCAIIPTLLDGFAGKGGDKWKYVVFRPGTNPLKNMAIALANSKIFLKGGKIEPNFADQLNEILRENVQGLLNVFDKYKLEEEHNLLIFIDDFEDIFAYEELYESEEDKLLFINLILKFIRRSNHPVYLVMALSSDFLSESSQYSGLPEVINDSQYMIPKMDASHLGKIIVHAFKSAGIRVESALIETILQDFKEHQANNYQLQYLLKSMVDLWLSSVKTSDELLTIEFYKKAGGLEGAINKDAEQLYSVLNKVQKRICTCLFKSIAQVGENERTRAVAVEDVSKVAGCSINQLIEVIDLFTLEGLELIEIIETYDIEERLDSLDDLLDNPFSQVNKYSKITLRNVELMESWPRLKHWVEEEQKYAGIYIRLANSAALFRQDKKGYFMNPELQVALDWYQREKPGKAWAKRYPGNFENAIEYLLLSQQNYQDALRQERLRQEQKKKRDKQFRIVLIIASIISLSLAGWAYNEKMHVEKAHKLTEAESKKLGFIQDLDSLKVIYIDALQDMDSAHIDQLRREARRLNKTSNSSMREFLHFAEIMIERDSLCKKGLKSKISQIQKVLNFWSKEWNTIDVHMDSINNEHAVLFEGFCDSLKKHCACQWEMLTSINYQCTPPSRENLKDCK
ncbi:hypothetical protein JKA74_08870 [Marivirga sp. S37H4]|uniref:Novel STAND NTPase 1 domain-containing protein n=1 Tax=Marivirga aurantiaca TaxID=2802615 RepID=A0A934WXU3_9BACT|nr:hypothetical protein [Marivirga aurantiaca]MBK6265148.1 hypothetical protein [Marivirga aurantiaca]